MKTMDYLKISNIAQDALKIKKKAIKIRFCQCMTGFNLGVNKKTRQGVM